MLIEIREWIMFLAELYICWILTIEYFFDKKVYESKRKKIKRTKDKVVVSYEDGQIVIKESPKDINVIVERQGE